ncbi:hypothetical protein NSU18_26570 [Paenibacillus sp. FSL H8-0048]|uniref:hypothetical protein n=1 Tax=Paenibacillus sp. FSL H8-0048 TaxID=2954508 RepID=UPI0030F52C5E
MIDKFNLLKFLIFSLIFLMIFAPAQMMKMKIALVVIFMVISILYLIKHRSTIKIHPGVFKWFYIYTTASAIFTFISIYNNNPQPLNLFGVYFIYPIIYFIFIIVISNSQYFEYVIKASIASFSITLIYNIVYVFVINGYIGFIPKNIFFNINENIGGMDLGFIKYSSESISYFIFFVPMILATYLIREKNTKRKNMYLILMFLGVLSAVFSGRTAFIITLIITPMVIIFLAYKSKILIDKRKLMLIVFYSLLFIVLLVTFLGVDFKLLFEKVSGSFSSENIINNSGIIDSGGSIRINQFKDLIKTWTYKPLLGWGDAAISINPTRNDLGGIYELSYLALLMQRGLVGSLIFLLQIIWIYVEGIKLIKLNNNLKIICFTVLVGFSTFMFSNATNPYLYSFDRLLILFLPLLILQVAYVNTNIECEKVKVYSAE